jgi:spore germination protein KB
MTELRQGHVGTTEAIVLTATVTGAKFIFAPRLAVEQLATAAWMMPLLNALATSFFLYLLLSLLDPDSDAGAVPQLQRAAGFLATLLLLAVAVDLLALTGLTLRRYAGETRTIILPLTPITVVEAVAVAAFVYGASLGLETLGRATMIYAVPMALTMTALILVAGARLRPVNLLPLLGYGVKPLLYWGLFGGLFREAWVVGLMWPYLRRRQDALKVGLAGVWLAAALLTVVTAATLMYFPMPTTARLAFPVAEIARAAQLGTFISNLESVFTFLLAFVMFLKLGIVFWMTATLFAGLLGLREYRPLLPILALAAWMIAYLPATLPEAVTWADQYVRTAASWVTYPAILAVWLAARLRKRPVKAYG